MEDAVSAADANCRLSLLSRLESQPVVQAGRWTRDELYEDDSVMGVLDTRAPATIDTRPRKIA
jgi:hypothetical protein